MSGVVISVRGLSKRYMRGPDRPPGLGGGLGRALLRPLRRALRRPAGPGVPEQRREPFWALQDITFDVCRGERVGIIGRNGAGKSTLLKILSRIAYPTEGEARIHGRVTSLLEVGTGFNPNLSGRENIYLNASIHGLERREIDARYEDIVEFSGVREFLDTPVRHYSSGMFMRLAFAVAAHLDPDVLLLDEVLTVGDLSFQQKCLQRVEGLASEGRTLLFVSHSVDAITRFCTRCLWLDHGRIVMDGPAVDVVGAYVEEVLGVRASRQWIPGGPDGTGPEGDADAAPVGSESGQTEGGGDQEAGKAAAGAPGNEYVRLVSARVLDRHRATVTSVPIDEPVGIEVVYDILQARKNIQPALHFRTQRGDYAFVVAYTDPSHMRAIPRAGRYAATAWVPGNVLNAGVLHVSIVMATPDPLERHCSAENALSFNVFERFDGGDRSARGLYGKEFPGPVRPLLAWETRRLSEHDSVRATGGATAAHVTTTH